MLKIKRSDWLQTPDRSKPQPLPEELRVWTAATGDGWSLILYTQTVMSRHFSQVKTQQQPEHVTVAQCDIHI